MPRTWVNGLQTAALVLVLVLGGRLALPNGALADDLADFHAAIEQVSTNCRKAIDVLEKSGPEETAEAVEQIREAWRNVVERFAARSPEMFAADENYATTMVDVDVRMVGALIIISAGRRQAAREALVSIADIVSQLADRSATR
jgi:hypothetical protein